MRILIHGINFTPELVGIGKYTGELAQWLAAQGHSVRVVTAPPYYPEWRIGKGYSAWRYAREVVAINENACRGTLVIYRCPLWLPKTHSGLARLIHLASFAISSLPVMLGHTLWRPDVVLVIEPPFLCAPQAWLTARLCGAKAWLHVQDFEIDAAFALGLLSSGMGCKLIGMLERILLRRFDRVSTISRRMVQRLTLKGVETSRTILAPNWVNTAVIYPLEKPDAFKVELGISLQRIVVLYSGNIGEKQGLEVLLDAARILSSEARLQFVLCGEGVAKRRLMEAYPDLHNTLWLPLQPLTSLNNLLNMADIHVLPQLLNAADLVMPSKLTGMLASGRPVIATAMPGTEIAEALDGCGLVIPTGDAKKLAEAVLLLANNHESRQALGIRARNRALSHLSRERILQHFEIDLLGCVKELKIPIRQC